MTPLSISFFANGAWSAITPIGQLGFSNPILRLRSRATSTLSMRRPGDPSAAPLIPNFAPVIIYASMPGVNGGAQTILFQGIRWDNYRDAPGGAPGPATEITIVDAWAQLEKTPFEHFWYGIAPGGNAPSYNYFSRIYLFEDISQGPNGTWGFLSAQKQLLEIINYAQNNCALPIQPGAIDALQNMLPYEVKGLSCAEAILQVLKTVPDAYTHFDYTTTPPSLHIRQYNGLIPITLPFGGTDANGRAHQSSKLKDLPELIPPVVALEYQQTNQVNGQSYTSFQDETFPPNASKAQFNALVIPLDLAGGVLTDVSGTVTSIPIDPTQVAFWQRFKPDLALPEILMDGVAPIVDTNINSGDPQGITITDDLTGLPVSLAQFPNAVIGDGLVAPWMAHNGVQILAREVTITGYLRYARRKPLAGGGFIVLEQMTSHPVPVRLKLTNSAAGTQKYSTPTTSIAPEAAPTGLAQFLYTALQPLQWQGTHRILDSPLTGVYNIISPANLLNLSGGNSDWTNINASIYQVEIDFFHNATVITLGPHRHLAPNQVFELFQMWTTREVWINPQVRFAGTTSSGDSVQLSTDAQKENTSPGTPERSLSSVIFGLANGGFTQIQKDATTNGGQIVAQTYDAEGNPDPTQPSIKADLQTLGETNGVGRAAAWRWMTVCAVDGNGNPIAGQFNKALFLCTAPEALTDA